MNEEGAISGEGYVLGHQNYFLEILDIVIYLVGIITILFFLLKLLMFMFRKVRGNR